MGGKKKETDGAQPPGPGPGPGPTGPADYTPPVPQPYTPPAEPPPEELPPQQAPPEPDPLDPLWGMTPEERQQWLMEHAQGEAPPPVPPGGVEDIESEYDRLVGGYK